MHLNIMIGRFNPPTKLHENIINSMGINSRIFIVDGEATKNNLFKNPLPIEYREELFKNLHPNIKIDICTNAFQALEIVDLMGYSSINLYCGSDRVKSYESMKKYFPYKINIVETTRTDDDISASLVRENIRKNNLDYLNQLHSKIDEDQIYNILRMVKCL